ncbi:hypothetical protein [Devosia sp. FKR38]|uniref:hypothetical protein n=1 Tax=Devosia sp. FKR38 TaxID=2562312 RepID=UPI0010C0E0E3|nr:hypothetical protein [Devosia sp. FKR38]
MLTSANLDLRFYGLWTVVFLAFPIAGLVANWATGGITDVGRALLGGAFAGLILGAAQYGVLRTVLPLTAVWIVATAIGLALGLAAATLGLGTAVNDNSLLFRGLVTGGVLALAQAAVLLPLGPLAAVWAVVVALAWPLGWWVTRSIGVDLSPRWVAFGASGAIVFQLLTGAALRLGLGLLMSGR